MALVTLSIEYDTKHREAVETILEAHAEELTHELFDINAHIEVEDESGGVTRY